MASYSYAECLQNSYQVNWRIGQILADRRFDPARRWLPLKLSGAGDIQCLSQGDRTRLTHVEMGAYAHLFGFVEEFIAPKVLSLAREHELSHRDAFDALTNFAAEEVKHMMMFREIRKRVDETLGFNLKLLEGQQEVARAVLGRSTGAVLLLTATIEWFTQLHYVSAFKDDNDLDPFTKDIFKAHWQEESQHARMDHLETLRVFAGMTAPEKDKAIDDLIALVADVDGLLQKQAGYDLENLEGYLKRTFKGEERKEISRGILRAKRYAFIESGVTHPNFMALFGEVTTPAQQKKVEGALGTLLKQPAEA